MYRPSPRGRAGDIRLTLSLIAVAVAALFSVRGAVAAHVIPDPAHGWSFGEGSGTVVADPFGGRNGTISGAAWVTDGHTGSALGFDGVDDRVVVPSGGQMGAADFSISLFVRADPGAPPASGAVILERGARECAGGAYRIFVNGSSIAVRFRDLDPYWGIRTLTTEAHPALPGLWDGAWHHVVVVSRSSDYGYVSVYVDGWWVGGTYPYSSGIDQGGLDSADLVIGRPAGGCSGDAFRGDVDDIRIDVPFLPGPFGALEDPIASQITIDSVSSLQVGQGGWVDVSVQPAPLMGGWIRVYATAADGVERPIGGYEIYPFPVAGGSRSIYVVSDYGGSVTLTARYLPALPHLESSTTRATQIAKASTYVSVEARTIIANEPFDIGVGVRGPSPLQITGVVDLYEIVGGSAVLIGSGSLEDGDGTTTGGHTFTMPGRAAGTYRFEGRYRGDLTNDPSSGTDDIVVEPALTTFPISINGGATYTTDPIVSVSTTATGAHAIWVSTHLTDPLDGRRFYTTAYAPQVTTWLTAPWHGDDADGTRIVWIRWVDVLGRWSAWRTDTIVLDRRAPSGSAAIAGGASSVPGRDVQVAVSATDAHSGVAQVALSNDGSAWTTYSYAPFVPWTLTSGEGTKTVHVKWRDGAGNWSAPVSDTVRLHVPVPTTFTPIEPARILDTRTARGLAGVFTANVPRTFQVAGRGGVPADAVAITGNLTVVGQTAAGFAALTTDAQSSPATSSMNFPRGDVRANNVTIALDPDGRLSAVYKAPSGNSTQLILDITGYFRENDAGTTYHPVGPVRLLDSRVGNGLAGPFTSGEVRSFAVAGRGAIPSSAVAVSGNLTIVGQTGGGYATVAPSLEVMPPPTSSLNAPLGDTRANGMTVVLSPTGKLSATYVSGGVGSGRSAHLVFDVTGYYTADLTGHHFIPLIPSRVLDTRTGTGLSGPFSAGTWRTLSIGGTMGIPVDAVGIAGNLTEVLAPVAGYVTMTDVAGLPATTSSLNFPAGDIRANGVAGALSETGSLALRYSAAASARVHLLLDVYGFFR